MEEATFDIDLTDWYEMYSVSLSLGDLCLIQEALGRHESVVSVGGVPCEFRYAAQILQDGLAFFGVDE